MKFEQAIGINTKAKLATWINDYISGKTKQYVILYGPSGNGKTLLCTLLAEKAGMEVFRVEPENVTNEEELNTILKSVNSSFSERLVLVDDYDYFKTRIRTKLIELTKLSKYPLIFTSSSWCFDSSFLKGSQLIRLKKPLQSELRKFLMHNYDVDFDLADKLALESKSVRSAILSIKNKATNDLTRDPQTNYKTLQDLRKRTLDQKINRTNINLLYKSICGYDRSALSLMLELAEYDYKIKANFAEIDPFIANNMDVPLEKVMLKQKFSKKQKPKSVPPNKKPNVVNKQKTSQKFNGIDAFL